MSNLDPEHLEVDLSDGSLHTPQRACTSGHATSICRSRYRLGERSASKPIGKLVTTQDQEIKDLRRTLSESQFEARKQTNECERLREQLSNVFRLKQDEATLNRTARETGTVRERKIHRDWIKKAKQEKRTATQLSSANEELKKQISVLVSQLEQERSSWQIKMTEMEGEKESYCQNRIAPAFQELRQTIQERDNAQKSAENSKILFDQLQKDFEELQKALHHTENQLSRSQVQKKELMDEITSLRLGNDSCSEAQKRLAEVTEALVTKDDIMLKLSQENQKLTYLQTNLEKEIGRSVPRCEELKKEVEQLKERGNNLDAQLSAALSENESLRDKNIAISLSLTNVQSRYLTCQGDLHTVEADRDMCKFENKLFKEERETKVEVNKELQEKVHLHCLKEETWDYEKRKLQERSAEESQAKERYLASAQSLEERLLESEQVLCKANGTIKLLQLEAEKEKGEFILIQNSNNKLRVQQEIDKSCIQEISWSLCEAQKDNLELSSSSAATQKELVYLREVHSRTQLETQEVGTRIRKIENELSISKMEAQSLQNSLEEARLIINDTSSEKERLITETHECNSEIRRCRLALADYEMKLDQENHRFQDQEQSLKKGRSEHLALQEQAEKNGKELQGLQMCVTALEGETERLAQEREVYRKELQNCIQKAQKLFTSFLENNAKCVEFEKIVELQESSLKEKDSLYKKMEIKLEMFESQIYEYRKERDAQKRLESDLKSEIRNLSAHCEKLKEKIACNEMEMANLYSTHKSIEEKLLNTAKSLHKENKTSEITRSNLSKALEEKEQTKAALQNSLLKIDSLQGEIGTIRLDFETCQLKNQRLSDDIEKFECDCCIKEQKLFECEESLATKDRLISVTQQKLEESDIQLQSMKSQAEDLKLIEESLRNEVLRTLTLLGNEKSRNSELVHALKISEENEMCCQSKADASGVRVQALQEEISQATQDKHYMQLSIDKKTSEIDGIKIENANYCKNIRSLETHLSRRAQMFEKMIYDSRALLHIAEKSLCKEAESCERNKNMLTEVQERGKIVVGEVSYEASIFQQERDLYIKKYHSACYRNIQVERDVHEARQKYLCEYEALEKLRESHKDFLLKLQSATASREDKFRIAIDNETVKCHEMSQLILQLKRELKIANERLLTSVRPTTPARKSRSSSKGKPCVFEGST